MSAKPKKPEVRTGTPMVRPQRQASLASVKKSQEVNTYLYSKGTPRPTVRLQHKKLSTIPARLDENETPRRSPRFKVPMLKPPPMKLMNKTDTDTATNLSKKSPSCAKLMSKIHTDTATNRLKTSPSCASSSTGDHREPSPSNDDADASKLSTPKGLMHVQKKEKSTVQRSTTTNKTARHSKKSAETLKLEKGCVVSHDPPATKKEPWQLIFEANEANEKKRAEQEKNLKKNGKSHGVSLAEYQAMKNKVSFLENRVEQVEKYVLANQSRIMENASHVMEPLTNWMTLPTPVQNYCTYQQTLPTYNNDVPMVSAVRQPSNPMNGYSQFVLPSGQNVFYTSSSAGGFNNVQSAPAPAKPKAKRGTVKQKQAPVVEEDPSTICLAEIHAGTVEENLYVDDEAQIYNDFFSANVPSEVGSENAMELDIF